MTWGPKCFAMMLKKDWQKEPRVFITTEIMTKLRNNLAETWHGYRTMRNFSQWQSWGWHPSVGHKTPIRCIIETYVVHVRLFTLSPCVCLLLLAIHPLSLPVFLYESQGSWYLSPAVIARKAGPSCCPWLFSNICIFKLMRKFKQCVQFKHINIVSFQRVPEFLWAHHKR